MNNRRKEVAEDKRLLTYQQVADMFGVDVRTVKRWRSAGLLRPVTLGFRTVRFRPEEIERFLKRGS